MFNRTYLISLYVFGALFYFNNVVHAKLEEKFSWNQLSFEWPSSDAELNAINKGSYIPENNLPLGIERWKNKIFVTVPRWKAGVAATLNYVDYDSSQKSPTLKPYPSWKANTLPEDSIKSQESDHDSRVDAHKSSLNKTEENFKIISTFRIQVDECDRLWVLDTGLADILGDPKQIASNAIVIIDLNTDTLIRRYTIPKSHLKEDTFFANIIIDSDRSKCSQAYAYVPDLGGYGVVVYSFKDNHSYRVKHNFFHFDPVHGDFNVGGVNFQWTDGVFGMAVGPKKPDRTSDVYFHALASTKEFKVSNSVLQNETFVTGKDAYYNFKFVGDRGAQGQSTAEVYDKDTGVIFYTQVNKDAVYCWNVERPYTSEYLGLIDSDSHTLVFPNDLKVDTEGTLWVLSDKMPSYIYKTLDPTSINYRILMGKTRDIIKGTPCNL